MDTMDYARFFVLHRISMIYNVFFFIRTMILKAVANCVHLEKTV